MIVTAELLTLQFVWRCQAFAGLVMVSFASTACWDSGGMVPGMLVCALHEWV